jgi:hypothetical protein
VVGGFAVWDAPLTPREYLRRHALLRSGDEKAVRWVCACECFVRERVAVLTRSGRSCVHAKYVQ